MVVNTGLRIARIHPFNLSNSPALSPLLIATHTSQARKRLAPRHPSSSSSSSHRLVSSATPETQEPKPTKPPPSASASTSDLTVPPPEALSSLNPPTTTRPQPLELPVRDPTTSTLSYWYHYGKAYTTFYKAGLRAIFTNRTLLSQSPTSAPETRSTHLLRERVRHDLSRIPAFALMLLLCGELTPLIVLVFPHITPYTCRIPKQVDAMRRRAEARRTASRAALQRTPFLRNLAKRGMKGSGHICRSLGLTSAVWDRVGLDSPFSRAVAERAVARLVDDDAMLREGGGVGYLLDEEVVLACEDRGIYVRERPVAELRSELEEWLRKSAPVTSGDREEAVNKVRELLLGLDES
ncbi:hypothetical protein F5B19DRAFT_476813 [Rostrohypoxylon terebratum]|nr:hypothetical protein F5B19DRAFT_476813 [Rostrohypoxylon terebratum]